MYTVEYFRAYFITFIFTGLSHSLVLQRCDSHIRTHQHTERVYCTVFSVYFLIPLFSRSFGMQPVKFAHNRSQRINKLIPHTVMRSLSRVSISLRKQYVNPFGLYNKCQIYFRSTWWNLMKTLPLCNLIDK